MRTIEDFRRMLEQRDPTQLRSDVDDAVKWMRKLCGLSKTCPVELREQIGELVTKSVVIALREAHFTGAARVVSPALRASTERVASAKSYGRAGAGDAMRGFDKLRARRRRHHRNGACRNAARAQRGWPRGWRMNSTTVTRYRSC
jgi:hypothetical protein